MKRGNLHDFPDCLAGRAIDRPMVCGRRARSAVVPMSASQSRDPSTGRVRAPPRPFEPPAPLLERLRAMAQGAARSVFNDPRVSVHIDRMVLSWLMEWDGVGSHAGYVMFRAANEARRLKAMTPAALTAACARSSDAMRLTGRER